MEQQPIQHPVKVVWQTIRQDYPWVVLCLGLLLLLIFARIEIGSYQERCTEAINDLEEHYNPIGDLYASIGNDTNPSWTSWKN